MRAVVAAVAFTLAAQWAHAGMFDDEEARKAIVDLRQRVATVDDGAKTRHAELLATTAQMAEQLQALRRSLIDLNNQLEALRGDMAKLRGSDEQLTRDVAELQRKQKDAAQAMDERLKKLEPQKVTVDGQDFTVEPAEKRGYEEAIAVMRTGDFDKSVNALGNFQRRYPTSGYSDSVRFWMGNALYGKRDYKEAIAAFKAFVTTSPEHLRAPEALLAVANCQAEMKDNRAAKKTIEDLIKAYPKAEAAAAGKERLATLK